MWAQQQFEALMFVVSGLKLAVPLITLGNIQHIEGPLTTVPGQADWLMGLLWTRGTQIRTVNTALFVMPERYNPKFVETAEYIVTINGMPWGLAIDAIDKVVSLRPEEVSWRTQRTKRPWLAGTVKTQMCALLDISTLGEMFKQVDKS